MARRILALAWDALSTVFEALDLPYDALSSFRASAAFRATADAMARHFVAATLAGAAGVD